MNFVFIVPLLLISFNNIPTISSDFSEKSPSIVIVTLIRNKAHTLPYFFSFIEKLDYPKDRISFWIRSDHNEDNSLEIIKTWLNTAGTFYHSINYSFDEKPKKRLNETSSTHWPEDRFLDVIRLKQQGLEYARQMWADYVLFLDADIFLTLPSVLHDLIRSQVPIVAPMLISDGLYSNFWCGMSDHFYYERTEEYKQILEREKIGVFPVPMVHSAVLVNLNLYQSDQLTFDKNLLSEYLKNNNRFYDGPIDDIIIFAISANYSSTPMFISNEKSFGYIMVPLDQDQDVFRDLQQLTNIKLLIINDLDQIKVLPQFKRFVLYPENDKISLSHIYMINLNRRPERRIKMENSFKELGIQVEHFPAIDGREIDDDYLDRVGIKFLQGYSDPYHKRPMTMGEIGCFLSHYYIWQRMVELGQEEVLVLEDDIKFEPFFKERAFSLLDEARNLGQWDLIYFGRKRLLESDEPWVDGSQYLVKAGYSYWTLGYLITLRGAEKLLSIKPLKKLVPVDEFLPIMFDKHPNETLRLSFEPRNLIAYSAAPLLLYPTHYTGEDGYISDTEDSVPIQIDDLDGDAKKKGDKEDIENVHEPNIMFENNKLDSQTKLMFDTISNNLAKTALKEGRNEL